VTTPELFNTHFARGINPYSDPLKRGGERGDTVGGDPPYRGIGGYVGSFNGEGVKIVHYPSPLLRRYVNKFFFI
jgi:hypothetical protein